MDKLIRKEFVTETKVKKDRTMTVRISTSNPDRSKDVIVPSGVQLDNYMRNPVVALSHKYDELAIAKTENIQITDDGIIATLRFPNKGVYSVADTVYELYKEGFMNAWSIGFIPNEVEDIEGGGRLFKQWELLEYSAVLVPDNPEALTLIRSKSIDTKEFEDAVSGKMEIKNKIIDLKVLFKQNEPTENPKEEEKPTEPVEEKPTEPEQPKPAEIPVEPKPEVIPEPKIPTIPTENNPIIEKAEEKPYPNEHSCRLVQPDKFEDNSFRRTEREHEGKKYSIIMGKLKGEDTMTEQAYRYSKDIWTESEAKTHCTAHNGISFEPATGEGQSVEEVEEKSKHLIGGKSKKIVLGIIEQMQQLQVSLQGLLEATFPDKDEEEKENHNLVIGLVDALKLADKTVGLALRDYKAKAELGKEPDDSLVPSRKKAEVN